MKKYVNKKIMQRTRKKKIASKKGFRIRIDKLRRKTMTNQLRNLQKAKY